MILNRILKIRLFSAHKNYNIFLSHFDPTIQPWHGFMLVCLGIMMMMVCFFVGFYQKYCQLRADTSSAHSFTLLKNFFTYVDDLEYYVFNKKTLTAKEFKEAIEKITKLKISDKEAEYLFTMFDANRDGFIDIEGELNITPAQTGDYC